jgi:hypothetical protein
MALSLYTPLKVGYSKDKKLQKKEMLKYGFYRDNQLSNDNEQTYYNPKTKKLLVNVNGTQNLKDWGTDAYLAVGKLKQTNRYKEADDIFKLAKKKYNPRKTVVTGQSLGGSIASLLPADKMITLDKGSTIGTKTRDNERSYRTAGDVVSLLSAGNQNTKTLSNPNMQTGVFAIDAYKAHAVDNIKNIPINIGHSHWHPNPIKAFQEKVNQGKVKQF